MTRMLFLDIDGTLVGKDQRIPQSAIRAIRAAQGNGHLVLICTGRAMPEIEPHILAPGFDGVIAVSGMYAEIHGRVLFDRFIDPAVITRVSARYDKLGIDYLWQSSRGMWATRHYMDKVRVEERFPEGSPERSRWHSLEVAREQARRDGVTLGDLVPGSKGTFFALPELGITYEQVRDVVGDDLDVVRGSMGMFAPENGETMCKGVSKGEGLRFAAATMGVPLADTVAIGDSDNDLTMIEVAGIGIAMGNGEQCAKDAADWVADAVNASGLTHAFERLGVV